MATKNSTPLPDGPAPVSPQEPDAITQENRNDATEVVPETPAKTPRKRTVKPAANPAAQAGSNETEEKPATKKHTVKKVAPDDGPPTAPKEEPAAEEPQDATQERSVPQKPTAEEHTEESALTERVDFSDEDAALAGDAPEFDLGEEQEHDVQSDGNGADLSGKSKEELVELLAALLESRPVQSLRRDVEAIKMAFYKLHRGEWEAARKAFVEAGGVEEDFAGIPDDQERKLKEYFSRYRRQRDEFLANLEHKKEDNLKIKLKIIEDLKELVNSSETINHTFNAYRDLQQRWRDTGPVPLASHKDIWETYNHHVENFYNFIKINKELRDLDLKRNYEAKVELCEQAEALILESSIVNAFHRLQKLHEQWRETGPVANEFKDTLWDRFREASGRINKQHQDHFEGLKDEQRRNLELKAQLCEQVEMLSAAPPVTRKEWNRASDKLIDIQKVWKTIGFAPKKENTKIYERFRRACDRFFELKRGMYVQMRGEMDMNLQLKQEICAMAEALTQSEEWKRATDELIALQKRWREIGPVARRHSDAIWKRFRAACDAFFERKSSHFSNVDSEHDDNLRRKRELLSEIQQIKDVTFDKIKDLQRRWSEIGFVPIKQKDAIQKQYKKLMDGLFATVRGSEGARRMDNFRDRVAGMRGSGDNRLRNERDRLYNKIKQLESDIATLENNIGFFSRSKNAEVLINDVNEKIRRTKEEMAALIEKVNLIDSENK